MVGFMSIDWETGYLDQLVVACEFWKSTVGEMLLSEAKWLSPTGVDLNVDPNNRSRRTLFRETQIRENRGR